MFASQQATAQNEVLDDINRQLRSYFAPLTRPASNYGFLYDMAAHQTDSVFFQTACPQPNVTAAWYKVYEEMYHAAYDTTPLTTPETVFSRGNNFYNDTIPIGIMRYSHYVLKPDAMTTNTYFDFDTVNNILSDKPGRPSAPYMDAGVFMAAPMVEQCRHRNPIFRIDPQLMFFDAANAGVFGGNNLQIDFGDGNGYIRFDPGQVTNYEVNYADSGEHQITVTLGSKYYPTVSSISVIGTGLTLRPPPPDQILTFPGIRAGFYGACNATPNSGKLVIYVSGIDLLDPFDNHPGINSLSRTVEDIYEEMIHQDKIVQLKNDGYNFLVVDWERSNIDIRFNALYLVNLLHQLKCGLDLNDNQQFVVIAESLGGIASRYALTYMETLAYQQGDGTAFFQDQNDPNNTLYLQQHPGIFNIPKTWPSAACHMDKMHNTRLLMTLDSPHQGANIPISLQLAYSGILQAVGRFIGGDLETFAVQNNFFLSAQASQQLLIYHYTTAMGTGMYKSYTSAPEKDRLYNQLRSLGNYPQYAKVMVISDGALKGQGQMNINTGRDRIANDHLLNFTALTAVRILWITVPTFKADIELRTNPSGPGQVVQADAGFYKIKIKLKWFGIRISNTYNPSIDIKEGTTNVLPFCTSAGSLDGIIPKYIGPTPIPSTVSGSWVATRNGGIFSEFLHLYTSRDNNGCTHIGGYRGINGFGSENFEGKICSDGMYFDFIPVQSALDYGTVTPNFTNPALGHDIEADPITDKLNTYMNPAVDVIMGWASTSIPFIGNNLNYPHLRWRNDGIFNLTGTANTTQHPDTYFSCRGTSDVTERGIINMEIGDEELYVENRDLPWTGEYQTEYTIRVNERNPYYEYLNQPFAPGAAVLKGIYSRSADFTTVQNPFNGSQGFARFLTDGTNTPPSNLPAFEIGPGTTVPNHTSIDAVLPICCQNYLAARRQAQPQPPKGKTTAPSPTQGNYLKLYPNPATGKQLTLEYLMPGNAPVQATIYNLAGQPVLQRTIPAYVKGLTVQHYQLPLQGLPSGMYLLQLTNGRATLQSKITINH